MKSKHDTSVKAMHRSLKIAMASMLFIFVSAHAFAQTSHTVRGIVQSADNNEPVPGTNIYLKNASSIGTLSDDKGQFEFPGKLRSGDILVFSFIGLKTTEYVVPEQATGAIVISMPIDLIQMVDEVIVEENAPHVATSSKQIRKVKANH